MNSYADALARYTERRSRGRHKRIKLGNNTYLVHDPWDVETPSSFGIKLHATEVVTYYASGKVVLDSGGWLTVTTKDRMNNHLPSGWTVWSKLGVWYLSDYSGRYDADVSHPYADGITIEANGSVSGAGEDPRAKLRLRKSIKKYARSYVDAFFAGEVEKPGLGDCFGCLMVATDGTRPMGGSDHIESHISESYYVPSILQHAVERFPVSKIAMGTIGEYWGDDGDPSKVEGYFSEIASEQIRKSIQRWCFAECGMQ